MLTVDDDASPRAARSRRRTTPPTPTGPGGSGCGSTRRPLSTIAGPPGRDAAQQHRQAEGPGGGAVEQPVGADADADRARRAAVPPWRPGRGRATAADRPYPRASIAAASSSDRSRASVITGRAISRNDVEAAARLAAQPPGRAHALAALDELRGDAERDRHRHPDLVQGRGHGLEEPLRVGEHVGGARRRGAARRGAARRRAPPSSPSSDTGPADADARGRGRERELGQREQDVGAVLPVEQHAEHDPDPDHDQAQVHVDLEAPRPRRVGAPGGHDVGDARRR